MPAQEVQQPQAQQMELPAAQEAGRTITTEQPVSSPYLANPIDVF
jgi:hypothetical protein